MVPKESGFNQSETTRYGEVKQDMVKLNKGSIFIITETQFAIEGQVI